MNKLVIALVLTALPSMSSAAGVDISWDDCYGGTPTTSKVFDCAANANYNIHFQFRLPAHLPGFVSITVFLDYQNATRTPLSPFWRFEVGGCQIAPATDGVLISDDNSHPAVPLGCRSTVNGGDKEDPWGGDGSGGTDGIVGFGIDFRRPGNGYFVLLDYRAGSGILLEDVPYWAFRLNFRTVNRAACPGCSDAGIFLLSLFRLEQDISGSLPMDLDSPDRLGNCLSINNGPPALCQAVPVINTTWGQVKSMYR